MYLGDSLGLLRCRRTGAPAAGCIGAVALLVVGQPGSSRHSFKPTSVDVLSRGNVPIVFGAVTSGVTFKFLLSPPGPFPGDTN